MTDEDKKAYWRSNLRLMITLLSVWFLVSFGASIILVDVLDQFALGSFRLGFWFAQQGSIFTFVALIFIYAWRMDVLDEKYGLRAARANSGPAAPATDPAAAGEVS